MSSTPEHSSKGGLKSASHLYYVCSLIAMGFAALKFTAGYLIDVFPDNFELDIKPPSRPVAESNSSLWLISMLQVIFVFTLSVSILFELRTKTKTSATTIPLKIRINASLKRLTYGFLLVALSWMLLYSWFAFFWSSRPEYILGVTGYLVFWIGADIIHAITAFFFLYCYFSLEYPNKAIGNEQSQVNRRNNLIYTALICAGFLLFSIAGRLGQWRMERLGPIFLSFWAALAMQYFIGKLDSFDLRFPRILIAPLYLYILLQMLWSAISSYLPVQDTAVVLVMTLVLKVYFLIVIHYWIKANSFHRYFEKFARDPSRPKKTRKDREP